MVRKKIVGETTIVLEKVISERHTKNLKVEKIEKRTERALKLECGHVVSCLDYPNKVPKTSTDCVECES